MAISKTNFLLIFKHNWTGFNVHKDFLKKDFDAISSDNLTESDIRRLKVSLNNMRESIENVEKYISEK
ncbi:hypothetical protein [Moritella viscosa]|uniref:Surface presentation of antigens protein spaN-Spa32 protein n=1 Tax=Moritella viscosa TaxID=80854 RepID=A0A1L0AV98_9GAMM|nr:hypothetical protein [Moritella viscosa]SGY92282.1 Surface presentation of antigens protein spaN-Spa32 protein [Moritella viscosa]SHO02383.1 Surface presentation of antigens protein spaN-Spa32 protein [Moritella viscosa]SHO02535.1 Surface presentation of antigens protein spaN-Spa32 protein [Moritella viscosa]SHO19191.1 Surface presentation of antigens protein spaN-Spa32 protein [Moritella viscosa]